MKRLRVSLTVGVLLALVGLNVAALTHREQIGDWFVLRSYTPPAAIAALAADDRLTPLGEHLFYINRPELEDKAGFNQNCSSTAEHSVVLGCYHGNRRGIHIYNVQDDRLAGVTQVTAAHEMLHQAYDRLSKSEKVRVDGLLAQVENSGALPARITQKLDLYRKSDPSSVTNEMHSILGTEVAGLPADLETYYKQYFNDRSAILAFSDKYQAEFASRQAKVEEYDTQLKTLNAQITANRAALETQKSILEADRAQIQTLQNSGNSTAYRNAAIAYNKKVSTYNALIDQTQSLISQYNKIVEQRNAISTEEQELQQALDSHHTETTR